MSKKSRIPDDQVFVENSSYNRTSLKKRIINEKIIPYECQRCGLKDTWQGEKISLHIDHINGVNNDNRLENLRFLCPNCHSLTDTYCGKNTTKEKPKCLKCGKPCKQHQRKYCSSSCANSITSSQRPSQSKRPEKSVLKKLLKNNTYVDIGKKYNVSDVTARKWAKAYDLI